MTERFDVVVVGSGAGGGIVAGELADYGRRVLLLELGPHRTAADFTRWEAKATHDLWWPIRFALIDGGAGGVVGLIAGRCVGAARRSTRRSRSEPTTVTSRSGIPRVASPTITASRSVRQISKRTTTGSNPFSASASAPTGRRAF
jgi:choline dehydrogenase-like flavoprotein